jgi:methyl-accepting chemotaxis protein
MKDIAQTLLESKLKGDINSAHVYLKQYLGNVSYKNGNLLDQNGEKIDGRYDMVDQIHEELEDVATIFVKEGNDFKRIITNIVKEDGSRAVGTMLGTDSKAYSDVKDGKMYLGEADILGKSYLTAYDPIFDKSGEVIGILFIGVQKSSINATINHFLGRLQKYNGALILVMCFIGILCIAYISRSIANPINQVTYHAEVLATGDFTKDIQVSLMNRKDEIGKLAIAFDTMNKNFRELASDILQASHQVSVSAEELTATSEQVATASEEVAKTICEIATGAGNQATDTENGCNKAIDLGENIEKNQEYMSKLNFSSKKVFNLVDEGLEIISDLSKKTDKSGNAIQDVYEGIVKTNRSSENIGKASQVVASIAEQTNLLALNAAIEAARAGEKGKGFAVVADEIRKLAEQSANSIKEIDDTVIELQKNSKASVKTIEMVLELINMQVQCVENTQNKYREIEGAITEAKKAIDDLNVSEKELEEAKGEILSVLQNLSAIAQQNAAGTEEISASTEEVSSSIEEVANSSTALAELSQELQNAVSKFKV